MVTTRDAATRCWPRREAKAKSKSKNTARSGCATPARQWRLTERSDVEMRRRVAQPSAAIRIICNGCAVSGSRRRTEARAGQRQLQKQEHSQEWLCHNCPGDLRSADGLRFGLGLQQGTRFVSALEPCFRHDWRSGGGTATLGCALGVDSPARTTTSCGIGTTNPQEKRYFPFRLALDQSQSEAFATMPAATGFLSMYSRIRANSARLRHQ